MDTQRLVLLFIFGFSILMLWEAWERDHRPKPAIAPTVQTAPQTGAPATPQGKAAAASPTAGPIAASGPAEPGETIRITTDLVSAEVDTRGGTLKRLELLRHKDSNDPEKNFVLISPAHQYEAQTGLAGEGGPNHRSLWKAEPGARTLAQGSDSLELRLTAQGKDGVEVQKVFTFHRNSYVVDVAMQMRNAGGTPVNTYAYFQFTHDGKPEGNRNTVAETFGAQSFTGFAVYTDEHKFQKVHPGDLDKGKPDHVKEAKDGWLAVVQHYFVAAWIEPQGVRRDYVTEKRQDGTYAGRILVPVNLAPGAATEVKVNCMPGRRRSGAWRLPRRGWTSSSTTAGSQSSPGRSSGGSSICMR